MWNWWLNSYGYVQFTLSWEHPRPFQIGARKTFFLLFGVSGRHGTSWWLSRQSPFQPLVAARLCSMYSAVPSIAFAWAPSILRSIWHKFLPSCFITEKWVPDPGCTAACSPSSSGVTCGIHIKHIMERKCLPLRIKINYWYISKQERRLTDSSRGHNCTWDRRSRHLTFGK